MADERLNQLYNQAFSAHKSGDYARAEKFGREMEKIAPLDARTWIVLAQSAQSLGNLTEAAKYLTALHEKEPENLEFRRQLTAIYQAVGYFEEAVEMYRPVFENSSESSQKYGYFGHLCAYGGHEKEAVKHFKKAESLSPGEPEIKVALGRVYTTLGQIEKAKVALGEALALNQNHIHGLVLKADLKIKLSNRELDVLKAGSENPSHHLGLRIDAAFGLAKALKNAGNPKTTFEAYEKANDLAARLFQKQGQRFNLEIEEANFKTITKVFIPSGEKAEERETPNPIFIIGLPRTGTTLVEQILSAHTQVNAGGEMKLLGEFPMRLEAMAGNGKEGDKRRVLDKMTPQWRKEYRDRLQKKAKGAAFVTDKMPLNFYWVGLAGVLFPGANFIFIERNPLDACLSMFFQPLSGSYVATTHLETCGTLYRLFQKYLIHWRSFSSLHIYNLQYEVLAENPEKEIKKLIEFLGLPWEEACLDFHLKSGAVRTLSTQQVREPVTTKYVGQWKPYEEFLDPLKKALEKNQ